MLSLRLPLRSAALVHAHTLTVCTHGCESTCTQGTHTENQYVQYGHLSNTSLHGVCERVIGGEKRGRRMTDCMLTLVYALYPNAPHPLVSPPLFVVYLGVMNRLPAEHCSRHKEGTLSPCPFLTISIHPSVSFPSHLSTSLYLLLFLYPRLPFWTSLILSAEASQGKQTLLTKWKYGMQAVFCHHVSAAFQNLIWSQIWVMILDAEMLVFGWLGWSSVHKIANFIFWYQPDYSFI